MYMIRVFGLTINELTEIVKDLKTKGYTLEEIEEMIVLE